MFLGPSSSCHCCAGTHNLATGHHPDHTLYSQGLYESASIYQGEDEVRTEIPGARNIPDLQEMTYCSCGGMNDAGCGCQGGESYGQEDATYSTLKPATSEDYESSSPPKCHKRRQSDSGTRASLMIEITEMQSLKVKRTKDVGLGPTLVSGNLRNWRESSNPVTIRMFLCEKQWLSSWI